MTGTERKVFQKYYPPDYDPRKLPKLKGSFKNKQFVQRIMAPFNMTCNTCGEYIYQGKKFNMRRETALGEFYLGLKIFRFYFRCPNCLAEISFKTDLENTDYVMEQGATRLFEAWHKYVKAQKEEAAKEEEEKNDPMKMLEKRTKNSRAEMEALSNLEDLREQSRDHASLDHKAMMEGYRKEEFFDENAQEIEDEKFVQALFGKKRKLAESGALADTKLEFVEDIEFQGEMDEKPAPSGPIIKRIEDHSSSDDDDVKPKKLPTFAKPERPSPSLAKQLDRQKQLLLGVVRRKPDSAGPSTSSAGASSTPAASSGSKPKPVTNLGIKPKTTAASLGIKPKTAPVAAGLGLLAGYGTSSDSD